MTSGQGKTPYTYVHDAVIDFQKNIDDDIDVIGSDTPTTLHSTVQLDEINEIHSNTSDGVTRPKRVRRDYRAEIDDLIGFTNHRSSRAVDRSSQHIDSEIVEAFIVRACLGKSIPHDVSNIIYANKVALRNDDTPTVKQALNPNREDRAEWIKAIKKEIDMLFKQGTIEPVVCKDNSRRSRTIRMVMQLKVKRKHDNSVDKYKARACADGSMLSNENFETFSPTVHSSALFIILQLSVIDKMYTCCIDVVGAYLYQVYPDNALLIYMILHPDVAEVCELDKTQLYRIRKYLYGLPDAGRAFYEAYAELLVNNGYKRCVSDPCVFTKCSDDSIRRTYVCIHVDDTFVSTTHEEELVLLQDILKTKFDITVNDTIESYLGIHITKLDDGGLKLTQPKLITSLLKQYEAELPSRTPSAPMQARASSDEASPQVDKYKYMRLLGSLMYIVKSRPDIGAALSYASTKSVNPTVDDFNDLLHMLAYIKGTIDDGLILQSSNCNAPLTLYCYVDASYLSHKDSKSHQGWTMSFGKSGCFASKSSKQDIIATSSTHAELRALYILSLEITYTITLMQELGRALSLPCIVFEDNQPVIDLVSEITGVTKRSKHFCMNIAAVREMILHGLMSVVKVPTELNIADILTKSVQGQDFRYKVQEMLGTTNGIKVVPIKSKKANACDVSVIV
jgi:hypothetical protein